MDRATIQHHLALAEERVQHGIKRAERQRRVVEWLERHGLSDYRAKGVLRNFNASLRRHQVDRDRLLAEFEQIIRSDLHAHSEDQIETGIHYFEKQQRVIAQLEEDGHDASAAREVLAHLVLTQTMSIAEPEYIKKMREETKE